MPSSVAGSKTTAVTGSSYSSTSDSSNCAISYLLQNAGDGTTYSGSDVEVAANGDIKVDTNKVFSTSFKISLMAPHGALLVTNDFTVTVSCSSSSNTFTSHGSQQTSENWEITNSNPEFTVYPFTAAQSECPITEVQIWSATSGGVSPPPNMTPASTTSVGSSFKVYSTQQSVETLYVFYIKILSTGGQETWVAGSFTLNVACGTTSTTVTEGSFAGQLTAVQAIQTNSGNSF